MAKQVKKTLGMRVLEGQDVAYEVVVFPQDIHEAAEIAQYADALAPEQVFKTLVVKTDDPGDKPMLLMLPADCQLVPKKLAAAIGAGRTRMARHEEAEALTGLQTGGISPLALLNKGFAIYIDERARRHDRIAVSAGKRGINLIVNAGDLIRVTGATIVDAAEEA
jgi:Cys-tRNA(Pro)/Cys-tRNA(Cys) deacylase